MKYIYILFLVMLSGLLSHAQVMNPSFESWTTKQNQITINGSITFQGITGDYEIDDPQFTYNEIVSWSSLNQLTMTESISDPVSGNTAIELVSPSSDANDLSTSVQIETRNIRISATITIDFLGNPVVIDTSVVNEGPGMIVSGEFDLDEDLFAEQLLNQSNLSSLNPFTYEGTGQAIDFRPRSLKGSYKYTGVAGDSALVFSGVVKDRQIVAYTIKRLGNANTWTNFQLDYNYLSCELPDTIITLFVSSNLDVSFENGEFNINSAFTGFNGSLLKIDGLSLDTISAAEIPPLAVDDESFIFVDEMVTLGVLLNDEICDGSMNLPVIFENGVHGTAVVESNGDLTYTPNSGFAGVDVLSYYVCNSASLCDTATWTINISTTPSCIAVDDTRSVVSGGSSVFNPLSNDVDCGGLPAIVNIPLNGIAQVESNGFISYSPLVAYVGLDSLTYRICSPVNTGQCSTAKIYYTVITGIKELPTSYIQIAPNPANNLVNIQLEQNLGTTNLKVFNLIGGQVVELNFVDAVQLNLGSFNTGIYILQFENDFGRATKKLVLTK